MLPLLSRCARSTGTQTPLLVVVIAASAVAAQSVSPGCLPMLGIPRNARISCSQDHDCPDGVRCSAALGRCLVDDRCVGSGGEALANGASCGGESVCFDGNCVPRFCGDGLLDFAAGEQCEPASDTQCLPDCTLSYCGDGIVDVAARESCDPSGDGCTSCTTSCPFVDGALLADCDLDQAACECAAHVIEADVGAHIVAAFAGDHLFVLEFTNGVTGRTMLLDLDLRSGDVTTAVPDSAFIDLIEDPLTGGVLYVRADEGVDSLHVIDPEGVDSELMSTSLNDRAMGRLAANQDTIWASGAGGIVSFDRASGERVLHPTEGCVDGSNIALILCGQKLACFDVPQGGIRTIDTETFAEAEPVELPLAGNEQVPTLFCAGGVLHAAHLDRVSRIDDDGMHLVGRLPPGASVRGRFAIAYGGRFLLPATTGGDVVTVLLDPALGRMSFMVNAHILGADGARMVGSTILGDYVVLDLAEPP